MFKNMKFSQCMSQEPYLMPLDNPHNPPFETSIWKSRNAAFMLDHDILKLSRIGNVLKFQLHVNKI